MNACLQSAVWVQLLSLAGWLLPAAAPAAPSEPNDELVSMIADLVRDQDREMRGLGLQQVREDVPGPAATKRFSDLLPGLSPEGQAALLEALGDRGDTTARPPVLQMLDSDQPAVRAAALAALGSLGNAVDVELLARHAASGSPMERDAAANSLGRLRDEAATPAIVAAYPTAEPAVRASLLSALGRRHAREALPTALAGARDPDPLVQLAALDALRLLADAKDAAELVRLVKTATTAAARHKSQLALLAACSRGREACAAAVIAGLQAAAASRPGSDGRPVEISERAAECALLPALARCGGAAALEALLTCAADGDEATRDEAVRLLSLWTDAAVAPRLWELAGGDNPRHQVLALRGLVRLADAHDDRSADTGQLLRAMHMAQRSEEQRLVLAALSRAADTQALAAAVERLDDSAVQDEAALAAVSIAQTLGPASPAARQALERVLKTSRLPYARQRAQQALAAAP